MFSDAEANELGKFVLGLDGNVGSSDIRNRVICGDAFRALPSIERAGTDLLFCDPPYNLNKVISKNLEDKAPKAAQFIKNFTWTAEDQNTVSNYIANDAMTREDAGAKWVKDNEAKWKPWIPAS